MIAGPARTLRLDINDSSGYVEGAESPRPPPVAYPGFEAHMPRSTRHCLFAALIAVLQLPLVAYSGDWPQWRYDAQRSAASPEELPAQLKLHWVRQLPRLTPAWSDQAKMQFDAAYEPIVAGQRLFVGSSHDNSVTAYDTRSGAEV